MSSHGSSNPGMQINYPANGASYSGIYVGSVLTASIWYMMAGTYDKDSGHQKLYLNNVLKSSATLTAGTVLYDNDENIGIGAKPGGTHLLNGKIATALIYDRALSAAELTYIFNSQRSRYGV